MTGGNKARFSLLSGILLMAGMFATMGQITNPSGSGSGSGTVNPNNGVVNAIATYAAAAGSTTVGPAANTACIPGATSGSACFTAPAVAGTPTNAITSTNAIAGNGVAAGNTVSPTFVPNSAHTTAGLGENTGNNDLYLNTASGGSVDFLNANSGIGYRFLGTGQVGTFAGNCAAVGTAANPSVASCSSFIAGSFSCATNASTGTCVVNTSTVTANSEIFITQRTDTTTGTRLGVTCNTTVSTVIPVVTAVTAGTSFTINLGTITTNPECFSYHMLN